MKREWIQIEHTLRYLESGKRNVDGNFELKVDFLKSAIIALMGFKLGWDDNEVFYENMKDSANKYIDELKENWCKEESLQLDELKGFVNNNL